MLLYTIPILLLSEIPCFLFKILDLLKLDFLIKYRIDNRIYPTKSEILIALNQYIKIFSIIFSITTISFIMMNYLEISPYKINKFNYSNIRLFIEFFAVCFINDIFYYIFHRIVHLPKFYWIHKDHHSYRKNSFALVNHYLLSSEVCIFIIPAIIGPILLQSHIYIVWMYMIWTNFIGTYGHSGYDFKLLNIFVNPRDHDNHHKYPKTNFSTGFCYSIVDRLFNSYNKIEYKKK